MCLANSQRCQIHRVVDTTDLVLVDFPSWYLESSRALEWGRWCFDYIMTSTRRFHSPVICQRSKNGPESPLACRCPGRCRPQVGFLQARWWKHEALRNLNFSEVLSSCNEDMLTETRRLCSLQKKIEVVSWLQGHNGQTMLSFLERQAAYSVGPDAYRLILGNAYNAGPEHHRHPRFGPRLTSPPSNTGVIGTIYLTWQAFVLQMCEACNLPVQERSEAPLYTCSVAGNMRVHQGKKGLRCLQVTPPTSRGCYTSNTPFRTSCCTRGAHPPMAGLRSPAVMCAHGRVSTVTTAAMSSTSTSSQTDLCSWVRPCSCMKAPDGVQRPAPSASVSTGSSPACL